MTVILNPLKQIVGWFNLRLVKLEPRLRAFVIFLTVSVIIYPLVFQVYGPLWSIVWSAWLAMFVLYFLFRAGYFSKRVLIQLPNASRPYPEKIRKIHGGVRFRAWDEVSYFNAEEADEHISTDDRVIGLEIKGDAVAYPLSAMGLREVVNEEFADIQVTVTWSPITYSARVYESIGPDGNPFTLAPTEHMVLNSPLLESENGSMYLQFTGEAIMGPDAGHQLKRMPCLNTTWGAWSEAWPNSELLSPEDTPETDVFENYYASTRAGLFTQPTKDKRLPDKDIVLGIAASESSLQSRAFSAHMLQQEPLQNETIYSTPALIVCERSSATYVAYERKVGDDVLTFVGESKNSFRPNRVVERNQRSELDGEAVPHSEYAPWLIRDEQTGSLWHAVSGTCIEGELDGTRLRMLDVRLAFWFAWSKFHGDVELVH